MKKNTKDTKVDYSSGFTTWINSLVVRFKNIILLISLIGLFSLWSVSIS